MFVKYNVITFYNYVRNWVTSTRHIQSQSALIFHVHILDHVV